jgi:hypothetical protein
MSVLWYITRNDTHRSIIFKQFGTIAIAYYVCFFQFDLVRHSITHPLINKLTYSIAHQLFNGPHMSATNNIAPTSVGVVTKY